jgi:hypothetical protein
MRIANLVRYVHNDVSNKAMKEFAHRCYSQTDDVLRPLHILMMNLRYWV